MCQLCHDRMADLFAQRQRVHGFVRRCGANHHVAEDVVARTYEIAWRRWHKVPLPAEQAMRWLCVVAWNVLKDHRRSTAREMALAHRLTASLGAVDARVHAHPEEHRLVALEAWERLRPLDREVLSLSTVEGPALDELAKRLDCTPKAASVRLSRARQRLMAEISRVDIAPDRPLS